MSLSRNQDAITLSDIANRIEESMENNSLLLQDESTTCTKDVSAVLQEAFQVKSVEMQEVIFEHKEYEVSVEGFATLLKQSKVKLRVSFTLEKNDIRIVIYAKMPEEYKISLDDKECLSSVHFSFIKIYGQDDIAGYLIAFLSIGEISYHVAGRYKPESQQWQVICNFGEPSSFRDLIKDIAHRFQLSLPFELLPAIPFKKSELVLYMNGCSSIDKILLNVSVGNSDSASIQIVASEESSIISKLIPFNANFSLESILKEEKRVYKGELLGKVDIVGNEFTLHYQFNNDDEKASNTVTVNWVRETASKEVTLTDILATFGMHDVPEVIRMFNLEISKVEMIYNISEKELDIQILSDAFETATIKVKDKNYTAEILWKNTIDLSELPIVGTHLHLLDDIAIEKMELYISSEDNEEKDVKSGVALLGSILDKPFVLQLYHKEQEPEEEKEDKKDTTIWIKLNKSLGIFEFHRFGIAYVSGRLSFLLDASLTVNPIDIGLTELGVGVNLSDPSDFNFSLSGMEITFENDTLSIGGAFAKSTLGNQESYDGKLLIKMGDCSLFAIGIYSGDSLLVYALLNKQLGGPPAAFVTGVAAGFGYNLQVITPSIDDVADFPLVSGALGKTKKENMLAELKKSLTPKKEQVFLAAGIKFTSFEMVESFALLTVTFGNYTEINLLGLSQVSIPPKLPENQQPLAFAQLALKASFLPEDGLFSLMSKLTSESYILSKDCKLTGGFAVYLWYSGEHEGDFVISLGGYHPDYKKPSHYPDVPRLGFQWQVTSELQLSGEMYFALTPGVLMAGGRLNAIYEKESIKAWFVAKADFFIAWKPFFYDAKMLVSLGVSAVVSVFSIKKTINLETAVSLHIWGPEFSGTAKISLYVLSFTIHFGAGAENTPPPIKWSEFRASFLPKKATSADQLQDDNTLPEKPISIAVTNGKTSEEDDSHNSSIIVSSDGLELLVNSAIPSTSITLNQAAVPLDSDTSAVGVLPMGEGKALSAKLEVNINCRTDTMWTYEVIYSNVSGALWGLKKDGVEIIHKVATGIRLRPIEREYIYFPKNKALDLNELSVFSCIERNFKWKKVWELSTLSVEKPIDVFSNSIMANETVTSREKFIDSFDSFDFNLIKKPVLAQMSAEANNIFSEEMILGVLI